MSPEIHRAARYPFSAGIEVTDMNSERTLSARTTNLSLFGCFVFAISPFPIGTKVSLRITHNGASVAALGKVAYSRPNIGMGISFAPLELASQSTLEKWIAGLRAGSPHH